MAGALFASPDIFEMIPVSLSLFSMTSDLRSRRAFFYPSKNDVLFLKIQNLMFPRFVRSSFSRSIIALFIRPFIFLFIFAPTLSFFFSKTKPNKPFHAPFILWCHITLFFFLFPSLVVEPCRRKKKKTACLSTMTKYGGSSTFSPRPCSEDESTLHHILLWHARHTLHPLLSFAPPPSSFFRFFTFHPSWTSTFNSPNNNEKKKHSSQQPQHSHSVAHDNAAMASDAATSPREVTSAGDAAEMGVYPRDPTSPGYPSSSANSTREGVSNNGATGITHPAISRIQRQSTISNVVFRGKEKVGGFWTVVVCFEVSGA